MVSLPRCLDTGQVVSDTEVVGRIEDRSWSLLYWSSIAAAAGAAEALLAVHDLRAAWGLSGKDSRFHLAGWVGLAASVLFVIAGGVVLARWARRGRSRAQLILAITICTVASAGVVIGVVLASQATAICACDAL
jgi:hypothetical protein